jgi:hypothetical protein
MNGDDEIILIYPETAMTDAEAVAADKAALTWDAIKGENAARTSVTSNLTLPTTGENGSAVTWASSAAAAISNSGAVTRPAYGSGDAEVTLTATITKGEASDTVEFALTVPAQPGGVDDNDPPDDDDPTDNNQPVNNQPDDNTPANNQSSGGGLPGASTSTSTPTPAPDVKDIAESEAPLAETAPEPSANPYADVSEDDWFYADVAFVRERGLMNGVSATRFAPDATATRAQIITVLARAAGADTTGGATWYSKAVSWAVENGISDGSDLDGNVTREQLATLLWRFAGEPAPGADSPEFTDITQISDWATGAMAWAASLGLVTGYPDGGVLPQGSATRAEVAAMLRRYMEGAQNAG